MIKKILISQPKPSNENSPYYELSKETGVELVFRPFIKVEGLTAKEFRQQKVSILSHTAVVFTSRHAIDYFFQLAKELRLVIPEDMKYFCVTETISLYIQKYVQYRKRKVFFGSTGKIDVMYRTLSDPFTEEEIKNFDYDMLICSTPTGVKYLTQAFPDMKKGQVKIGVFGPATAKAIENANLNLDLMAGTKEYPSMVSALKAYLKKENGN